MKKQLLFILICLCLNTFLIAQNKDCATAITICKKDTLQLQFSKGVGVQELDGTNAPCFGSPSSINLEYNSIWLRWRVVQSGTLTFTITPKDRMDDIDFVVFRLNNDSCNAKTTVRCMASGTTLGFPSEQCLGSTGLRLGETDISEPAGCSATQNSFLAPLNMTAGETYAMCINNFSVFDTAKATISFCGTALLGCESVVCSLRTDNKETINTDLIGNLFPNPTTGNVFFETNEPLSKLLIFNNLGQVLTIETMDNKYQNKYEFNVQDLPAGQYIIALELENKQRIFRKLIKN
jgi:Secretion system C-terminal sorting domain